VVIADGESMLNSIPETAHPNMQNDPPALEHYIKGTMERMSKMSLTECATWAAEQTVYAAVPVTRHAEPRVQHEHHG
jgi:hypothetical protein